MAWGKGESGNPRGRPRIPVEIIEAFRARTHEALLTLIDVMHSDDPRYASARVRAAEVILNRAWGPPEYQALEEELAGMSNQDLVTRASIVFASQHDKSD